MLREERGHGAGVVAVALHADGQRLHAAEDEPAVERSRHRAEGLLQEPEALGDGRIVGRGEPADHVGMPAEVLRGRVDDDVGAQLVGALEKRGRERRVDDDHRADRVRGLGGLLDVDQVQERVRRRLQPDDARGVVEVLLQPGLDLRSGEERELVALRLVDLGEHPVRAAVDVVHGDDAVARLEQVHDRRRRAEARRVREPVVGALERREAGLERRPRRVPRARVVVALVHPDVVLEEGRRLVDGRDHRPGRRVGLLPVVNRPRLEIHSRSLRSPSPPDTSGVRPRPCPPDGRSPRMVVPETGARADLPVPTDTSRGLTPVMAAVEGSRGRRWSGRARGTRGGRRA